MARDDVLYLPDATLSDMNLSPGDVADAIESALVAKAEGRLCTAPKSALLPGGGRYMMSTLAVGDDGFIVVKQVSVCPDNPSRDLPAINGAIMVLDANTGLLRAIVGANWVTAIRTAALSAVAARRLADPASETIAFVGTGVQAHAHLDAFREMFPLKRIRAVGRGKANLDRLCATARDLGLEAETAETPEQALRDADLVVTSVTLDYTIEPFLDARWLKRGAFAAITDLCIPWLPQGLEAFGTVIVDDREQEAEAEKPMLPYESVSGDLTELVAGKVPGPHPDKPRAFAFRGIALGDYATAVLAVKQAEATGAGRNITA
ncbi:MAG: ornithine cyclodeaminase family protein [Silicimonas sp.]|nr:ornithine cyclodeaminase family protein [Silicimonas sp.]MBT8425252.1 ornithine cyclodeaminase family protein [Silicimonas sp.]NNF91427.1 ornithine cyclodeaminase family protein [Boseongicola sp.]NNL35888.1 ornithine cyclodeaminase family protein [Silicimonas sp.]NNL72152.1 ornithine cyclodeaminase family protein [Silicimonas sp.]